MHRSLAGLVRARLAALHGFDCTAAQHAPSPPSNPLATQPTCRQHSMPRHTIQYTDATSPSSKHPPAGSISRSGWRAHASSTVLYLQQAKSETAREGGWAHELEAQFAHNQVLPCRLKPQRAWRHSSQLRCGRARNVQPSTHNVCRWSVQQHSWEIWRRPKQSRMRTHRCLLKDPPSSTLSRSVAFCGAAINGCMAGGSVKVCLHPSAA